MKRISDPQYQPPKQAEAVLSGLFKDKGWIVESEPQSSGSLRPDLVARKGKYAYVVEVKAASEGRSDRVIPLLSQAILQAQAYSRVMNKVRPLAVVMVGNVSPSLIERVQRFSERYAPEIALGVASRNGARLFIGEGLGELNEIGGRV